MKNTIICIMLGLLIIILSIIGIKYYKSLQNNNDDAIKDKNNNRNQSLDGIELISTREENDKIIQEYEVILNGNKKKFNIVYELELRQNLEKDEDDFIIKGNLDNEEVYILDEVGNKKNYFNVDYISNTFNERNFIIINGTDAKNYLLLHKDKNKSTYSNEDGDYIYIYNDDLKLINKEIEILIYFGLQTLLFDENNIDDETERNYGNMWYKDTFNICNQDDYCQIRVKIENDKIYALVGEEYCNQSYQDKITLEERMYTINNNKLEYKVVNTYPVTETAGMCRFNPYLDKMN